MRQWINNAVGEALYKKALETQPEKLHEDVVIHRSPECELLGTYGGDLTHALSAWTSTSRELTDDRRERIPKLLSDLARDGHHTPFEKSSIHFLVRTDIATHIHILKHRIGVSVNAESARYKRMLDTHFYVPIDLDPDVSERNVINHVVDSKLQYNTLLVYPEPMRHNGTLPERRRRNKEASRLVLPYSTMLRADVMFNFRSFMHFVGLRRDKHAQFEVAMLADMMLQSLVEHTDGFGASLDAFGVEL